MNNIIDYKVKDVIDIIKDMDIKNKLSLQKFLALLYKMLFNLSLFMSKLISILFEFMK